MIYGYDGDFEIYKTGDNNYSDNGLLNPDRIPNPPIYEVYYFYQNIWTKAKDLFKGEIYIYNENFFRDLSAYYLEWELLKDGIPQRGGRVEELHVPPTQTASLKLDLGQTDSYHEWLLNIRYIQKEREGVIPMGHVVAKELLVVNSYQAPAMDLPNMVNRYEQAFVPQIKDQSLHHIVVEGENFAIRFSKSTRYMNRYIINGSNMLNQGAALTPNFWRAPTDNDYGARLQQKYSAWKNPDIRLVFLTSEMANNQAVISAQYDIKNVSAKLYLTYTINNKGSIKVT